ncbi:AFR109Wp [Eremothecium gossypii ATCC 10895]|uniref:AFR109Wp n=1 Tax=Eremothecium gossypii (strain ATCC 10895 / CBS 109.51 / FGSC 9923 / NRRL Y-1056) TaxID=284811 RepID=Q754G1_EREGS|nr:AFR109Wp [Eremothecium gossypii ATCC 10895]AAS53480.1 AFR109Wp [Eremothecium gossypii ATCC 10895]AEY97792.1 FAFR109Wp [Eremothecium gossypii FDAG1]
MNGQDRRRILGPSNSKALKFGDLVPAQDSKAGTGEVSGDSEASMFIQDGMIVNANGSSYLEVKAETHNTLLVTTAYGPRPIRGSFTSRAAISVHFKEVTLERWDSGEVTEMCNFLNTVFSAAINVERYPKSGIDIFLNLIQHSNVRDDKTLNLAEVLPDCISGITLALMDAGIELKDVVAAGRHGCNVVAFVNNAETILGFWQEDDSDVMEIVDECKKGYFRQRDAIIEHVVSKNKS